MKSKIRVTKNTRSYNYIWIALGTLGVLLAGLIIALSVAKQKQDPTTQAATVECSDWCAGDSQCYQSNGRRPSSGQACSFSSCSPGTSPCCANGICGSKTVGSTTPTSPSGTCDNTSVTAVYCRGKAVGFNTGPCTCQRTTGTLCACVIPTAAPTSKPPVAPVPVGNGSCNARGTYVPEGNCGCKIQGYELQLCRRGVWSFDTPTCKEKCSSTNVAPGTGTQCPNNGYGEICETKKVGDSCGGNAKCAAFKAAGAASWNGWYCDWT